MMVIKRFCAKVLLISSVFATPIFAEDVSLDESAWPAFLAQLSTEAKAAGVNEAIVNAVMQDVALIPRVVSKDRAQPSRSTVTIESYLQRVITPTRIELGRKYYAEHYEEINRIATAYGVDAKYLVALWGVESSYGQITGTNHVPSALATMAFEGRRRDFFSQEFINALKIIEAGHIDSQGMKGSWAGAMGQCQFMPSSFLNFAADGDGDGKADIWNNPIDVLASTANYLKKSGWRSGENWARQVTVNDHQTMLGYNGQERSLAEWQALGVRRDDASDLPQSGMKATLRIDANTSERIYLLYHNYDVFLRWNRSSFFATSVGYLADRIGFPKVNPLPQSSTHIERQLEAIP